MVESGRAEPGIAGRQIVSGKITNFDISVFSGLLQHNRASTSVPPIVKIPSDFTYSSRSLSGFYDIFDNSFNDPFDSRIILDLRISNTLEPFSPSQVTPDLSSTFSDGFRDLRLLFDLEKQSLATNPFGSAFSQELVYFFQPPGATSAIYTRDATEGKFTAVPEPSTIPSTIVVLSLVLLKRSRRKP